MKKTIGQHLIHIMITYRLGGKVCEKTAGFSMEIHNGAPLFVVVTSTQVFLVLHGSQLPQKTRDDVMDMWHGIYGIWGLVL